MRKDKIPLNKRPKTFVVFIDLKKAFDVVDRTILREKLIAFNFNPQIINSISELQKLTMMNFNNEKAKSMKGVP